MAYMECLGYVGCWSHQSPPDDAVGDPTEGLGDFWFFSPSDVAAIGEKKRRGWTVWWVSFGNL